MEGLLERLLVAPKQAAWRPVLEWPAFEERRREMNLSVVIQEMRQELDTSRLQAGWPPA